MKVCGDRANGLEPNLYKPVGFIGLLPGIAYTRPMDADI